MAALLSLFLALSFSLVITRIATEALTFTGLSRESARFQARSAFTGAGFTTHESEGVVRHPVRRRIIMLLMLLGNAGVTTVVSALVLSFISARGPEEWVPRFFLLLLGVVGLWIVATNDSINRIIITLTRRALRRWTHLDARDYAGLLRLSRRYSVAELQIEPGDWLADKQLQTTKLRSEGIVVLGIQRSDETYVGAPDGKSYICPGDVLIVYGRTESLTELDSRRAGTEGDRAHAAAVADHARDRVEHPTEKSIPPSLAP